MRLNSNYTGRVPRNLETAFGPHTSSQVDPMPDPPIPLSLRILDRVCYLIGAALLVGLLLVAFATEIPK